MNIGNLTNNTKFKIHFEEMSFVFQNKISIQGWTAQLKN